MGIDPKLQWCQCGYHWRPTKLEKILMIIMGEYVKTCPRCQCKLRLVLVNYVVCKERRNVDKRELWQRC